MCGVSECRWSNVKNGSVPLTSLKLQVVSLTLKIMLNLGLL